MSSIAAHFNPAVIFGGWKIQSATGPGGFDSSNRLGQVANIINIFTAERSGIRTARLLNALLMLISSSS